MQNQPDFAWRCCPWCLTLLALWGGFILWPGGSVRAGDRSPAVMDVERLLGDLKQLTLLAATLKQQGHPLASPERLLKEAQTALGQGELEVVHALLLRVEEALNGFWQERLLATYQYNGVGFSRIALEHLGRSVAASLAVPRQNPRPATVGGLFTGALAGDPTDASVTRYPAVVILHGSGQRAEDLLFMLYDLARHGYVALAMDFHWHPDQGYLDVLRFIDYVQQLPMVDPERLGLISFSGGGHYGLRVLQRRPQFRCWISFYGIFSEQPLVPTDVAPLTCHTLILHGGQDKVVPVQTAYAMETLLGQMDKSYWLNIFPDQPHGFTGTGAQAAYGLSLRFLAIHLLGAREALEPLLPVPNSPSTHHGHDD